MFHPSRNVVTAWFILLLGGTASILTAWHEFHLHGDVEWSQALLVTGLLATALLSYLALLQGRALRQTTRLAEEMTEQLRRLAMVAERTTNGVIITNAERRIVWVNEGFTRITGYSCEEAMGRNPGQLLQCPNTDRDTQRQLRQAVRSGNSFHGEILNRARDGREYWIDLEIQPLHDAAGTLTGFIAIESDISDRVKAERRAHAMAHIVREAPNEIYFIDARTLEFVEVNQGACVQLGFAREELLGMSAVAVNPDFTLDQYREKVAPVVVGIVDQLVFDTTHSRKDGSTYPVHANLHRSRFEDRDVLVLFVVDLTDRQQLEQQLAQAQKLESIGQLAAGIAHEINTPMQCVMTNVEYLQEICTSLFKVTDAHRDSLYAEALNWQERKAALHELEQKYNYDKLRQNTLDAIGESVEASCRVVEVVRAMKTMSHPGTDEKRWIDLNEMIRSATLVARNHWKYCATLDLQLDEMLPLVRIFAGPVNQVLLNLLVNAADAIHERIELEGTGELGEIRISTWQQAGGVVLEITDTGCGMSDEVKQRAFDPFFTTKEVGKGTGQGLAISYNVIVQQHQGRIEIDSERGVGTTLRIWLPGEAMEMEADVEVSHGSDVVTMLG